MSSPDAKYFVQPEDLCTVKAKKIHVHYNSIHSDQVVNVNKTRKRINITNQKYNLNKTPPQKTMTCTDMYLKKISNTI